MKSVSKAWIAILLLAVSASGHSHSRVKDSSSIGVVAVEPPSNKAASAAAASLAETAVKEPNEKAVAYENTATLAGHLNQLDLDVKSDIKNAKTHSEKALEDTKILAEKADTLFGVKALKGLDREAHQLRGQLQRRHEWMAKFLDNIIADYQNAKAPEKPVHPDADNWNLGEPVRTGWTQPAEHQPPAPKPWNFGEAPAAPEAKPK